MQFNKVAQLAQIKPKMAKKKAVGAEKVAKLKAVKSAAPRRPGAALKVMGGPAPLPKAPVAGGIGGGMMKRGGFR